MYTALTLLDKRIISKVFSIFTLFYYFGLSVIMFGFLGKKRHSFEFCNSFVALLPIGFKVHVLVNNRRQHIIRNFCTWQHNLILLCFETHLKVKDTNIMLSISVFRRFEQKTPGKSLNVRSTDMKIQKNYRIYSRISREILDKIWDFFNQFDLYSGQKL